MSFGATQIFVWAAKNDGIGTANPTRNTNFKPNLIKVKNSIINDLTHEISSYGRPGFCRKQGPSDKSFETQLGSHRPLQRYHAD